MNRFPETTLAVQEATDEFMAKVDSKDELLESAYRRFRWHIERCERCGLDGHCEVGRSKRKLYESALAHAVDA